MSSQRLLVLLHTAGQSPQMWQDQVTALPPGFRAVAPWLHGLRPAKDDSFDVQRAADEIAGLLDVQGAASADLCALGLGARVALQVAIDHPSRVRRLVLASPPSRPPLRLRLARQVAMRMVPRSAYTQQNIDKAKVLQAMRAVADVEQVSGVEAVTADTLVLRGVRDQVSIKGARLLHDQLAKSELRTIERAGLMINTDQPAQFNEALYGFLETRHDERFSASGD